MRKLTKGRLTKPEKFYSDENYAREGLDISMHELFGEVGKELNRAILKHGLQEDVSLAEQYIITAEEFGEIAKGLCDRDLDNVKTEIEQTVAMLVKLYWLIYNYGLSVDGADVKENNNG